MGEVPIFMPSNTFNYISCGICNINMTIKQSKMDICFSIISIFMASVTLSIS